MKREWNKQKAIRRAGLVAMDIICIAIASFMALLTRFEFRFTEDAERFLVVLGRLEVAIILITLLVFWIFRMYSSLWEYAGMDEIMLIVCSSLTSGALQLLLVHMTGNFLPRSYYIIFVLYMIIIMTVTRFTYRMLRIYRKNQAHHWQKKRRIMIVGAGEAGRLLLKEIQNSEYLSQKVCCFIDDDPKKKGNYISGVRVVGGRDEIPKAAEIFNVQEIIITMPSVQKDILRQIVNICNDTGCQVKVMPGLYQLVNNEVAVSKIRPISIEDLLGRDEVKTDLNQVMDYVAGKVVMVTGGGGSIGSELCRQIAGYQPKQLIIFDIYENNAYSIEQELKWKYPDLNLKVLIGSVRDANRLDAVFAQYRPQIVYHAAAHKHVPLMEESPNEAIKNNVLGTYKLVKTADKYKVQRFVQISTDKAVNPTNIMGASKRMCEMIIQTENKKSETEFVAVRFGNVLGSNGSVIPLFKKQIEEGGPVTVTHPDIIRYFMTIPEAVALVLQAGAYAKGGEIFVLDMGEPVKILDLAKNMIKLSGYVLDRDISIEFTGLRPGEKLYEELLMDEEGMTDTPNKLIHIGHPIDVDEERLEQALRMLESAAQQETSDMKALVASVVSTYHPYAH